MCRPSPKDGFADRLHSLRFLRECDPSYRVLTLALVGLPPTEYASLSWTHTDNPVFQALHVLGFSSTGYVPVCRQTSQNPAIHKGLLESGVNRLGSTIIRYAGPTVKLRVPVALSFVIVATSVFAQPQPLSLCIVQTKSDAASQDEPSAGPFAMAMYNQLASQRLQNGTALHITVLAASMQRDILPEVHRLNCSWSLQLWYHRSTDRDASTGDVYIPMGDQDSLLFTLWNSETRKVIARGSGVPMRETQGDTSLVPNPLLYSAFARQIVNKLNQLP